MNRLTEQQREERFAFLTRRQQGIGGSDLPVILGLSPYGNALDVYHEKTRPIRKEDIEDETIHQIRGHVLEPVALAAYWRHTGRRGSAVRKPIAHPDYPRVVVSRDFRVFSDASRPEGFRGTGVGEIKCPISMVFRAVHETGLRDSELVQLQTNIAASRDDWGTFCYFNMEDKDGPVLALDQAADPQMGEFLLSAGQRFWDEHVVTRVPPDPTKWRLLEEHSAPPLADLSGEVKVLPTEDVFARHVARMLDAKDLSDESEEHYRGLQRETLAQLTDAGIGKAQIPGLARLTVVTKAGHVSFDRDRLANALPLCRDAVERWLRTNIFELEMTLTEQMLGRMLFECCLDLSTFETTGAPSRYLLAKRSAKE